MDGRLIGQLGLRNDADVPERASYRQLLLNLDISASAFYNAGPLIDTLTKFLEVRDVMGLERAIYDKRAQGQLNRFLRNVAINVTYRNSSNRRRYKISKLSDMPANRLDVEIEGKPRITIEEYFRDTYNITLKYPWLPCVVSGAKNNILIPCELCDIRPNQRFMGKTSDRVTADMIKIAATKPFDRKGLIEDGIA